MFIWQIINNTLVYAMATLQCYCHNFIYKPVSATYLFCNRLHFQLVTTASKQSDLLLHIALYVVSDRILTTQKCNPELNREK